MMMMPCVWKKITGKICMHRIQLNYWLHQVSSSKSMKKKALRHCILQSSSWLQVWCSVKGSSGCRSIGNLTIRFWYWNSNSIHSFLYLRDTRTFPSIVNSVCFFLFSGYDFGYLIKILSNSKLPEEEVDFFEILRLFFPIIYDVKYLMKSCKNLKACTLFVFEMCRYNFRIYCCQKKKRKSNWYCTRS